MKKLTLRALKKLPERFIDDATIITTMPGQVIAAHPMHAPIQFTDKAGRWKKIKFRDERRDV